MNNLKLFTILWLFVFSSCEIEDTIKPLNNQINKASVPDEGFNDESSANAGYANVLAVHSIGVSISTGFNTSIKNGALTYEDAYMSIFRDKDGPIIHSISGTNISFMDVTSLGVVPDITISKEDLSNLEGDPNHLFGLGYFPYNGSVGPEIKINLDLISSDVNNSMYSEEEIVKAFKRLVLHEMYHTLGLIDDGSNSGHIMTKYGVQNGSGSLQCRGNIISFFKNCSGDELHPRDKDILTTHYPPVTLGLTSIPINETSISLSWNQNASAGIQKFDVFRKSNNAGYSKVGTVNSPINTFIDHNVQPAISYTYQIEAYKDGFKQLSNESTIVTNFPAPTGLSLVDRNPGTATLAWIDKTTTELEFVIEKASGINGENYVEIGRVGTNNFMFTDMNFSILEDEVRYRVKAINQHDETSYSNVIVVHGSPFDPIVIDENVAINWYAFPGATSYKLYRRYGSGDRNGWELKQNHSNGTITNYLDSERVHSNNGSTTQLTNYKIEISRGSQVDFVKIYAFQTKPTAPSPHDF